MQISSLHEGLRRLGLVDYHGRLLSHGRSANQKLMIKESYCSRPSCKLGYLGSFEDTHGVKDTSLDDAENFRELLRSCGYFQSLASGTRDQTCSIDEAAPQISSKTDHEKHILPNSLSNSIPRTTNVTPL